jgi:hypothetical protein
VRPGQRMVLVSPAQPAGFIYALQDVMRPNDTAPDAGKE